MFCVLFYIVVSLNVLNCKKDGKIKLSLTKKEADFVLDVLSNSMQNGTEEPGQDYKSDNSDKSPNSDDMVEGTDALAPGTTCCFNVVDVLNICVHSKSQNNGWSSILKRICDCDMRHINLSIQFHLQFGQLSMDPPHLRKCFKKTSTNVYNRCD